MGGKGQAASSTSFRRTGERVAVESLMALSAGIAIAVVVFGVVNLLKLPRQIAATVVPANFALVTVLLGVWWATLRRRVPGSWVHPLTVAVLWLALANVLLTFSLVREPLQNNLVALLVIAAGTCLLSNGWLAVSIGGMLLAWAPVAWHAADSAGERFQFALMIFAAAVLAVASHFARLRVRRRLERSELRYRRLFQQSKDAVSLTTPDGRLIDANPAAGALFGFSSPDQVRDLDLSRDLYADGEDRKRLARELLTNGFVKDLEVTMKRRDGEPLEIEATVSTIQDEQGEVSAFLAVSRDITERKREREELACYREHLEELVTERTARLRAEIAERRRAEDERSRAEARFHESQKLESLGLLAGGVAHDFNNLLVGILGSAGILRSRLAPDSPCLPQVARIETAAERASDLANQMLAYSGKGRFRFESCDLRELVEEMANLLRASISKNAELDLRLDEGLPRIRADVTQLRQVVMNLITNASDALGGAAGRVIVRLGVTDEVSGAKIPAGLLSASLPPSPIRPPASAAKDGPWVYLEVSDSGCGMDEATRAKVFDPFFTTKVTGRGLGMAAILGIVRGHRGLIEVDSEPGIGTTFRVLFPESEAPAPAEALDSPPVVQLAVSSVG